MLKLISVWDCYESEEEMNYVLHDSIPNISMLDEDNVSIEVQNKIDFLISFYNYKKLSEKLSKEVREYYKSKIPILAMHYDNLYIASKGGLLITYYINRIVIGDYGAYFEIDPKNMVRSNLANKKGQEYRFKDNKYKNRVKYYWLCSKDNQNLKIYYQRKKVSYADYIPGMCYISVFDENIKYDIDC